MKDCNCKDCKCDVIKSQKEKYLKMFPNLKEDEIHVELVGDIVKDNVRYKTYKTTIDYCNEIGESIFIEDKQTIEIPVEKKSKIREEEELNQYVMFVHNEKDKIKEEISEVYGKEIADSIEYGDIKVYNKEEEIDCNFECKKEINKGNIHVTINYSKTVPYPKNSEQVEEKIRRKEEYERRKTVALKWIKAKKKEFFEELKDKFSDRHPRICDDDFDEVEVDIESFDNNNIFPVKIRIFYDSTYIRCEKPIQYEKRYEYNEKGSKPICDWKSDGCKIGNEIFKNLNKNSESLKESYEDFNKCIDEYLNWLPEEDENETDDSKEESQKVKEESETKKQTIENFVKEAKEKFLKELNEKFCVYSTRKIGIEDIKCEKCSNGCMCIIDKSCNELDFSCNLKYSKFYEFPEELKQYKVKDEEKEEHDTVKDIESFWNPKGNNTKDCEENYKAWLKLQRINVCEYLSELYPKYYFSTDDVDFRVILENKTKKAVRFEYDETFIGKRIYYSVIKDFDSEIDYINKWDEYVANSEVKYRFEDKQYRDELSYNEIVDKLFRRHPVDTFEDFLDFCCRW